MYSERLFSEFGDIYEAKRSRLLPSNAEKLLFLEHNYPRLDKHAEDDAKLAAKQNEELMRRLGGGACSGSTSSSSSTSQRRLGACSGSSSSSSSQ